MKTFKLILKSLINNQAVIDGARKKPWYFAVIFFFLSAVLAVLPIMVSYLTSSGSDFINKQNYIYGYDVSTLRFIESINDNDIDMIVTTEIDGTKYLSVNEEKWNTVYGKNHQEGDIRFIHLRASDNADDLDVYYTNTSGEAFNSYVTDVLNNRVPGTDKMNNSLNLSRQASAIVFGRYEYVAYLYECGSQTSLGYVYGNYNYFDAGFNIKSLIKVYDGDILVDRNSVGTLYQVYTEGVFNNLKNFYDTGYIDYRNTLTWQSTLIMFGIDVLLTMFLGLLIFFLTRGKTNIYRVITFWETQKIAYWATLSPAIIALVGGFLLSSMSYIFFPLCIGMRIMWLTMRSLRPQYTENTQPTAKELAAYEAKQKSTKNKQVIDAEVKDKPAKKEKKNRK